MKQALSQARDGACTYSNVQTISEAGEFSVHAPITEIESCKLDKIGGIAGSGGKVIREIVETSGAKVDISDDGTIALFLCGASIQKAYDMIYLSSRTRSRGVYTLEHCAG